MAVRLLSSFQNNLRACNLHPDLKRLTEMTTGLIVISGPTGSGKSTTLAALVEEINSSSARHIIAIESPLEYVFTNRRSFIRQREVPTHSPSYEQALVDALRENPDVLVIGEMRTPEVMRLTLSAAETGHLVIATMHSATCAEALTRICMSFPAEIQGGIRAQLADCFVGVVCQRLEFLARVSSARSGVRNPAAERRLQGDDSRRPIQPDRQCAANRRRDRHVEFRPLPTLGGAKERLGAADIGDAVAGGADRCRRRSKFSATRSRRLHRKTIRWKYRSTRKWISMNWRNASSSARARTAGIESG